MRNLYLHRELKGKDIEIMKTLKTKLVAYLLSFFIILGFMPINALAAELNLFHLLVNEVDIEEAANNTIVCGNGTANYDSVTNTLTLNNATINNGNPAICYTGGSLTIKLQGNNTITSADRGIYIMSSENSGKTLRFEGDGSLTVNAEGDAIQADNIDIVIDGCNLKIFSSSFSGINSWGGMLTVQNGADVMVNSSSSAIVGERGIAITGSTVDAAVSSGETNAFYSSNGEVTIKNSIVNAKAAAENAYPTIWGLGIKISDNSNVTTVSPNTNALFSPNVITVSNSTLEAKSTAWAVWCNGSIGISGSTVKAYDTGGYTDACIHAGTALTVSDNADVLADGGIEAINGITVTPANGKLIEYKAGTHEGGESGTQHRGNSPYDTAFTFAADDIELGYAYIHIKDHIHAGGSASCTNEAICADCGKSYGGINSNNHTGEVVWKTTETTHSSAYNCCNMPVVTEEAHEGGTTTCTEKAVCEICSQRYGEADAFNHANLVKTEAKSATHIAEGNTEYWYCDGCDKYFDDEAGAKEISFEDTVVPKLAEHTVDDTGWHSDATNHWNICECGAKLNEAVHSFKWVIDKKATTTEKGQKHEECSVCGYIEAPMEIPATVTMRKPDDTKKPADTTKPAVTMGKSDDTKKPADMEKPAVTMGKSDDTKKPADMEKPAVTTDITSPKTGDDSNFTLWIMVMIAASTALTVTVICSRKKKYNR
ncbi:hypothetical protein C806_04200 [Lachnospiraceae bacterium 3-1]|nr:hypothetical protein C806_04200 [Lachnospiraceae bacterium 3-1]